MKNEYINQSKLMANYKITRRLVKLFFPDPDFTCVNPFGAGLPPELMFSVERVERVMETEEFQRELAITRKHSKKHRLRGPETYPGRKGYPKEEGKISVSAS